MVSMRSKKPICARPYLSDVCPTLSLKWFQCSSVWRWLSLVLSCLSPPSDRCVMSLALCPQVVSQAPQHFRSEKLATCEGCFARQSICSVVSLPSGMSSAVHPQEFRKVDVDHRHIPVWASHFTFHLLQHAHWICEDDGMCDPTVTYWGNPAEGMGDCFNTIQLYCLCVEKFAFWLVIYIKIFNKINNKTSTTQWNTELKTAQIQRKILNNNNVHTHARTHARTHPPSSSWRLRPSRQHCLHGWYII